MATSAEIRDMAATRLGILSEGNALQSNHSSDLDQAYVEVYAQLAAKNLTVWDSDEDIPDEYAGHVVDLVAMARVNDYGIPNDRYSRILNSASVALREIKELQTSDAFDTPTPDYF